MGILILTKHEKIPTSNNFHPTVITLSPSYLPLITFSNQEHSQETISGETVDTRLHNSRKRGQKAAAA